MTVVVGTAGHIDHGKTTLLRALTGIDADRLPEEQRRGMTIDVGYAHLALPDGTELDFVDVPGHEGLVGNMLVGAGEIDCALLVVAADDGPRAQTLEHLELLDAFGIRAAVAVITKTDLVDGARVREVEALTRALLDRTSMSGAAVIATSAVSGDGLDRLRGELLRLRDRVSERDGPGSRVRLSIDRAFSMRGRGLVVTGSLRGGQIDRGATLRLEPGGRSARVREIQVHGRAVEQTGPGRTALNLAGVEGGAARRGMAIAEPGAVAVTDRILVALRPAAALRGRGSSLPGDRARLRLHVGTDQVDATIGRGGREAVWLGDGSATAILRLRRPVAAAIGDPFVLRRSSAATTEAGGRVLDTDPARGISRRRATPERLADLAAAVGSGDAGSIPAALLALHGVAAADLAADVRDRLAARAIALVAADHEQRPGEAGPALDRLRAALVADLRRLVTVTGAEAAAHASRLVDDLVTAGRLARDGDRLRDPAHRPAGLAPAVEDAMERLLTALAVAAPPPLADAARAAGCPPEGVRALERTDRIVRLDPDLAWATATWRDLAGRAVELAAREPLTPAALRDATGTSRKYVMAILEDLDRRGALRRTPAGHVPGPRAAAFAGVAVR